MSSKSPWSIKGVDEKTREKMKKMAEKQGITLAELLTNFLGTETVVKKAPLPSPSLTPPHKEMHKPSRSIQSHNKTSTLTSHSSAKNNFSKSIAAPSTTTSSYTQGSIYSSLATKHNIGYHQMPMDEFKDMVIEGRRLRDALRTHTKELQKDISEDMHIIFNEEFQNISRLVKNILSNEDTERLDHAYPSLQEFQSEIRQEIEQSKAEIKQTFIYILEEKLGKISNSPSQDIEKVIESHTKIQENLMQMNQNFQHLHEQIHNNLPPSSENTLSSELKPLMELIPQHLEKYTHENDTRLNKISDMLSLLSSKVTNLEQYAAQEGYSPNAEQEAPSAPYQHMQETSPFSSPIMEPPSQLQPSPFTVNDLLNQTDQEDETPLMASYQTPETMPYNNEEQFQNHNLDNLNDFSADEFATIPQIDSYNEEKGFSHEIPEEYK